MTLQEWTSLVTQDLERAGFAVGTHAGFPIVKCPATLAEGVRLLKLSVNPPADRRIYAEGMLFIPAGSWERRSDEAIWRRAEC
jgi:hypothetical protein